MNDTTTTTTTTPQAQSRRREAAPPLSAFTHLREERIRITDLDFQQHVNNAAITALLANGRFDFLSERVRPHVGAGDKLVIASLQVDFRGEMQYTPAVFTGSRVLQVGRTSMRVEQVLYQGERCAAQATSVWVLLDAQTNAAKPWPHEVRQLAPEGA